MKSEKQIQEMIDQMMYNASIAHEGWNYDNEENAKRDEKETLQCVNMLKWVLEQEPINIEN